MLYRYFPSLKTSVAELVDFFSRYGSEEKNKTGSGSKEVKSKISPKIQVGSVSMSDTNFRLLLRPQKGKKKRLRLHNC